MVSTWVELCNIALTRLGEDRISALTGTDEKSVLCNEYYGKARDSVLEMYDWSCVSERQELAVVAGDTLSEYDYRYQLPTDPQCLVPRQLLDCEDDAKWYVEDNEPYKIFGDYLYTDLEDAGLRYTGRPASPVKLSSWLAEVIALKLAMDIGYKLKADFQKITLYQKLQIAINNAYAEDTQSLPREEEPEKWTDR